MRKKKPGLELSVGLVDKNLFRYDELGHGTGR